MPDNNVIVKAQLRIWQAFLLIASVVKEVIKIAFVFVGINNNAFFLKNFKFPGLFFGNYYAGKEGFEHK